MAKLNLISLFSVFLISAPFFVLAQIVVDDKPAEKASEYCQLKHKISIGGEDFFAGDILENPGCGEREACFSGSTLGKVESHPHWAGICFLDGIMTISAIVMYAAVVLVGVVLIIAGIMYATAAGNSERLKLAKTIFYWNLLGVLVATLSRFIPDIVRFFIGV